MAKKPTYEKLKQRINGLGLENDKFQLEMFHKRFLVKAMLVIGLPTVVFFGIHDFIEGRYFVASLELFMLIVLFSLYFGLYKTIQEEREYMIYRVCFTLFVILFGTLFIFAIGIEGKFSRTQWCYIYPILAFFLVGLKEGLLWVLLFYCGVVSLILFNDFQSIAIEELKTRFLFSLLMVSILAYILEYLVRRNQKRLFSVQHELRKSQDELIKHRDHLEELVKERSAGLTLANEDLKQEIKQHKQAQEELRESEEKYRLLAENVTDVIWISDMNFRLTYISPSITRMVGYSVEEAMSTILKDTYTSASLKVLERAFVEELAIEKTKQKDPYMTRTLELEGICKDGSTIQTEAKMTFLRDQDGNPVGILGVSRDITDRKRMEEEKAKLEAQLHQAQKMETIGILAGGVAHDLNNILSGIISYPELLLMDLPEDSPLRKPLLTIKSSGEKAAVVVQDLLTLARRGVTSTEIVNLNSIISEQLKSPEYEKLKSFHPNVDIKTNLEKDLLNINGSTAHLSKTVFNLISNAAEAMPDGGKVLISTENLYIDRPIRGYDHVEEGDYVTVTVSDTGIGISKEDIERIFEPFYTKKVMGRSGSGLGMSVVWGTVKDHNGYIDIESTKGKGTTFTLYFPITREEIAIDKSHILIEDYMGKGESILIVDDVEEQREIASVMLKKLGYSVTSVSSGEEAIEYMKDNSVDLLVLDMIMDPGIDGLETYKRILKLNPKQKAIIASGFSETDRVKKAKKLGAGAYVKKPYVLEKMGLVIKKELDK